MLTVLDRWLDALDNVVHADGKKLSVLALASMLTSNIPYVILLFCCEIVAFTNFGGCPVQRCNVFFPNMARVWSIITALLTCRAVFPTAKVSVCLSVRPSVRPCVRPSHA